MELNLGRAPLRFNSHAVNGRQVTLDGEDYYCIDHFDRMPPFLMSVVSSGDHWMFISSTGALTAGRQVANLALFPYYTDDKIHDSAEQTGSKTFVIATREKKKYLWEPFARQDASPYRLVRRLYKSLPGDKLIFEETNLDLALVFRYRWASSEKFGWVRHASITNEDKGVVALQILDGIQNLLPCGTTSQFQLEYSTLLDAYKRSELDEATGLALFRLSAIPVDRPEPAEALRTNVVWSAGLPRTVKLLSPRQVGAFRRQVPLRPETDVRGVRGAYFVSCSLSLKSKASQEWWMVADVAKSAADVAQLQRELRSPARLMKELAADIARGTGALKQIVGAADGLQKTADTIGDARHFNNVLFNVMRGGTFFAGYEIESADLRAFIEQANREVARRQRTFLAKLPERILYAELAARSQTAGDPQLERLCLEYLPLTFSRRHGDPSRPWNRFSIATKDATGRRILNYEGNWRDIFQNWEALALSFPGFARGMVCKFVNASTADGYNPYRVTRDGMDWEILDPKDPWSHIGYWGDHQIIYLLKLLELLQQHEPATLQTMLTRRIFSYANLPYRIKPYADLLRDPKDTVEFDVAAEEAVRERCRKIGADGKLVWDAEGAVCLVNLAEKLLVPLLAKFSNFIPGAGIWLNTQRPEWNDANNALVGSGVSMVTLYYVRRYLAFCLETFAKLDEAKIPLSGGVATFLTDIHRVLASNRAVLQDGINDGARKRLMDELGKAGERYRKGLYQSGVSSRRITVRREELLKFLEIARDYVDQSIRSNRRRDGLYHAYNLVTLGKAKEVPVRRLYEMLEGQVAALSSGSLSATESLEVLKALRDGAMFRPDQHSYTLYPNRELPRFMERNNLPPAFVRGSVLLRELLSKGNRALVEKDVNGRVHFAGSITNARDVSRILDQLAGGSFARDVKRERTQILDTFESLFDHQSFTGRSGTFFAYEGLGSIYWHMVSKLLLAVQETFYRAADAGESKPVLDQLAARYYDIREGIGDRKAPEVYGAFPMDPYSHTPAHTGARQPGLTGQVKEDVLCRAGELGVMARDGRLLFRPLLLQRSEFVTGPFAFDYYDLRGRSRRISLTKGSLGFTCCQVPVIYHFAQVPQVTVRNADGSIHRMKNMELDSQSSQSVFDRADSVRRIDVFLEPGSLR